MAIKHYYLSGSGMSADVSAFDVHSLEKPGEKRETQFSAAGRHTPTAEIEYRIGAREEKLSPNDPIEKYWERKGSIGSKEEPPGVF